MICENSRALEGMVSIVKAQRKTIFEMTTQFNALKSELENGTLKISRTGSPMFG